MPYTRLFLARIVAEKAEETEPPDYRKYINSYTVAHEQEVYRQAMEQKEQEEREYTILDMYQEFQILITL